MPGLQLPELAECDLVLQRAGRELALQARVVMVGGGGVGLEVVGFGAAVRERIAATFGDLGAKPVKPAPVAPPAPEPEPEPELATEPVPTLDPAEPADDDALELPEPVPDNAPALLPQLPEEKGLQSFELDTTDDVSTHGARSSDEELLDLEAEAEGDAPPVPHDAETVDETTDNEADAESTDEPGRSKIAKNVHERVRGLNLAQQIKLAHTGETAERILLERLYGKHVWEALLRNPRITGPEVARIARMGQLPKPLIEIIVGNGGWLQIPEVRRSLLSNPRLVTDQIQRVLYLLPKHELKLAAVQSAYPHAVRDIARRMVGLMKK